jgi:hypothetical protein
MSSNRSWVDYGHVISKWLFVSALARLILAFVYLVFGLEDLGRFFKDAHE